MCRTASCQQFSVYVPPMSSASAPMRHNCSLRSRPVFHLLFGWCNWEIVQSVPTSGTDSRFRQRTGGQA